MKKLIVLLTTLLLLVGCSSTEANISTNDVLFTIGKNKVTQKQIFHTMKATDRGSAAIRLAQAELIKDVTDESIQEELDDMVTRQKEDLKGEFLNEIKKLGFESEEDYIEKNLKPYVKLIHLLETTISSDFDRFAQEQVPRKIAVLEVLTKENATKAKDLIDNGSSLSTVATELKEEVKLKGDETLTFLSSSTLPNAVTRFLKETNEPAISDIIETGETDKKFYIAQVVDADVASYKEEVIKAAMDSQEVSQRELARLYKTNGFKVYDLALYKALQKTHTEYLAN